MGVHRLLAGNLEGRLSLPTGMLAPQVELLAVTSYLKGAPEFLWEILRERLAEPEANISHEEMPTMAEHLAYVARQPYRAWYIIAALGGEWIGNVSLSHHNEIGIYIRRPWRRRGYAREAIKRVLRVHEPVGRAAGDIPEGYVANINPENSASIALFTGLGAKLLQVTYHLDPVKIA